MLQKKKVFKPFKTAFDSPYSIQWHTLTVSSKVSDKVLQLLSQFLLQYDDDDDDKKVESNTNPSLPVSLSLSSSSSSSSSSCNSKEKECQCHLLQNNQLCFCCKLISPPLVSKDHDHDHYRMDEKLFENERKRGRNEMTKISMKVDCIPKTTITSLPASSFSSYSCSNVTKSPRNSNDISSKDLENKDKMKFFSRFKSKSKPNPSMDFRPFFTIGVNAVAKAIEKSQVELVVICKHVDPPIIVQHIPFMTAVKNIPLNVIPLSPSELGVLFGVTSLTVFALKVEDHYKTVSMGMRKKDVFLSLCSILRSSAGVISIPWLRKADTDGNRMKCDYKDDEINQSPKFEPFRTIVQTQKRKKMT